jgi:hypothetical protein
LGGAIYGELGSHLKGWTLRVIIAWYAQISWTPTYHITVPAAQRVDSDRMKSHRMSNSENPESHRMDFDGMESDRILNSANPESDRMDSDIMESDRMLNSANLESDRMDSDRMESDRMSNSANPEFGRIESVGNQQKKKSGEKTSRPAILNNPSYPLYFVLTLFSPPIAIFTQSLSRSFTDYK